MELRLRLCLSDDSTQQMGVSLILLRIILIAMIVTIIAGVADGDCGRRKGYKLQELCECPYKHLSFLATLKGRVSVIGHPRCRARSSSRPPLISGNKGGRVSRITKIARGEGGVEGCEGSDVTSHIAAGA